MKYVLIIIMGSANLTPDNISHIEFADRESCEIAKKWVTPPTILAIPRNRAECFQKSHNNIEP